MHCQHPAFRLPLFVGGATQQLLDRLLAHRAHNVWYVISPRAEYFRRLCEVTPERGCHRDRRHPQLNERREARLDGGDATTREWLPIGATVRMTRICRRVRGGNTDHGPSCIIFIMSSIGWLPGPLPIRPARGSFMSILELVCWRAMGKRRKRKDKELALE